MQKKLILIIFAFTLMACSVSSRLSNKYEGKGVEVLYKEMGSPQNVKVLGNGNKLFEYVKETFVRETEISTGRGTLDPRVSPSFMKVETYRFEIDNEGIIVRTVYEKQIEK